MGNVLADGTLLDPGRLDQQEKVVKNFFGGEDQGVGQNEKELDDVFLAHVSTFDEFLEEHDGFRGTGHDDGIDEQVGLSSQQRFNFLVQG
jgi:hypothetical protein